MVFRDRLLKLCNEHNKFVLTGFNMVECTNDSTLYEIFLSNIKIELLELTEIYEVEVYCDSFYLKMEYPKEDFNINFELYLDMLLSLIENLINSKEKE